MHKPAVALSACKQRHKRGNQLVSQALSLDESANWEGNERNRLAIQQQIEKSAVIVKLYREGAECLRGILRENPSRLANNRDQDDLKDMQFSISRTLEMIHTRTELLLQFINDPKHRRISIPRTTTTNIPKRKPIDSTRLPVIKGVDSTLVSRIMDEVVDSTAGRIVWDDISGLEAQKALLRETVVLPFQRPDIFVGVRAPARGILMFGPPGTGKTLMAKAVAGIAHCTFFALSASSITSKWIGESEKLIRALFACARHFEPAIIFIDEIDSLLQARNDSEHEAMRRVKTEFLLQFDGMNSSSTDRIVVIGATNRPADLDEAARRRFTKRILIPLPDATARNSLLQKLLKSVACDLKPREFDTLVHKTEGFSAADISALASDIALHPIRDLDASSILTKASNAIRPITWSDVQKSLQAVKSSVDPKSIKACQEWNSQFGSC